MESRIKAFQKRLLELGYMEGRNIVVEYHYASGNYDRITALTADLVRSKADVIVTWALPVTQGVKDATTTIPVVMAGGGEAGNPRPRFSRAEKAGEVNLLAASHKNTTRKR